MRLLICGLLFAVFFSVRAARPKVVMLAAGGVFASACDLDDGVASYPHEYL
ncbi:MAG: hypothetical protein M2R45_02829 [Verrucomicrobia subdivision 3 bacterium]|nr:hypothetical protein [Limisphaerales bacterium]MCS1415468.1 hypothetical protein [Limisphaerales bacterium]